MARVLKTPVTSTLIASLIPLVPGSGIYFTMSYFVENKIPEHRSMYSYVRLSIRSMYSYVRLNMIDDS